MTASNTVPLGLVSSGEMAELVAIRGGHKLKKRLADLGLTVGMPVRVLRNYNSGPIVLAIKNDRNAASNSQAPSAGHDRSLHDAPAPDSTGPCGGTNHNNTKAAAVSASTNG